jgi:hypothetical protein
MQDCGRVAVYQLNYQYIECRYLRILGPLLRVENDSARVAWCCCGPALVGRPAGITSRETAESGPQNDFMVELHVFVIRLVAICSCAFASFQSTLLRHDSTIVYMTAQRRRCY